METNQYSPLIFQINCNPEKWKQFGQSKTASDQQSQGKDPSFFTINSTFFTP